MKYKSQKLIATFILSILLIDLLPLTQPVFAQSSSTDVLASDGTGVLPYAPTPAPKIAIAPTPTNSRKLNSAKDQKFRPAKTIFELIEANKINISNPFRTWALEEIKPLDEAIFTLSNTTMGKVDTSAETKQLLAANTEIFTKVSQKYQELRGQINQPEANNNDLAYAFDLYYHYQDQKNTLTKLHQFNQVFECLLIKAEIGGEINGETYEFAEFYNQLVEKGEPTCKPGPNIDNSDGSNGNKSTTLPTQPYETSDNSTKPGTENTSTAYTNIFSQIIATIISPVHAAISIENINIYDTNIKQNLPPEADKGVEEISKQYYNLTPEQQQAIKDQTNTMAGSNEKIDSDQTVFPAPLEFHDPTEVSILLPTTITEYNTNKSNGQSVDNRIYFLLYHIYRTLEKEGDVYDSYIASKVIQDATTPTEVQTTCGALEDNPKSCFKPFTNVCGITSAYYFLFQLATGNVDNLGVPFKDRAHLKIWLGANSPQNSDEQTPDDTIDIPNPHYEFKAVDISEIGLYNESVDCSLCRGLPSCKMFSSIFNAYGSLQDAATSVTDTAAPGNYNDMAINTQAPYLNPEKAYAAASLNPLSLATGIYTDALICLTLCKVTLGAACIPCCPRVLDTANPETVAVQVKWQNENYSSILSDLAGQGLDQIMPFDPENGFSLQNMLQGLSQNALQQLFNSNFQSFDVAQLAQGGYETFMNEMGNQWLDSQVFNKLGLPAGFSSGINWLDPHPESLLTAISGNYLDEELGLKFGSFTPIMAAMISGNFQEAALSSLNLTPNLNLPPKLQEAMNVAIQNGDKPTAMGLAFANLGLKQINSDLLGWPDGILDLDNFSGTGFIGIANKLGQHSLAQIEGLPTNSIFDINNPKNTAMSLSGSLLSDVTDNEKINLAVTTAISQNQNLSLNDAMKLMSTEDISQLFNLSLENGEIIKKYLDNPTTPFVTLKNEMLAKIDFAKAATINPNFTPESLQLLFDYGLNPAYSDDNLQASGLMMSALSNSIKLNKIGIDLNQTDIEKLAYMQDYIQIVNNLPDNMKDPSRYEFGYNPLAVYYSPELQKLTQEFTTRFGASESIPQFHDRLLHTIDQSILNPTANTTQSINETQYLVQPLKIQFANPIRRDELIHTDYLDTITTTPIANSNLPAKQFVGVLRSLNVDLNSLEIVPASVYEQKANDQLPSTNPQPFKPTTNNSQNANPEFFIPGEIYYAYPKIDMAEIILPGIRGENLYKNQLGNFKLLASSTNVFPYSLATPITIQSYYKNDPIISTTLNQDPFQKAFLDKYQVEYKQPDNSTKIFDKNAFIGGSQNLYQTFQNIGTTNNQQSQDNLSNIGTMMIASSMTGINVAKLFTDTQDQSSIKDKISQLTNAMGIIKSWQTGNLDSGIRSSTSFLKTNGIFDNISTSSSWNIDDNGKIIIQDIDLLSLYSNIENGQYEQVLQDIPFIQNKLQLANTELGASPMAMLDLVQNFTPEKASTTIMDMMANHITSESGLEKLAVVQELSNTLGVPPDPANIPQLLNSQFFQENVLQDIDPQLLGDISGIYGLIGSGQITPQKAISTIMTANFFQDAIGKEGFQEFMGNYGGLVNAALTGDPKSIANTIISSPKINDEISGWLQSQGISEYFDIAGIQSLINGDIKGFVKTTAVKYLQKELISKLDDTIGGVLGNSILSILDGKFPYEAMTKFATEYLITNFLKSGDQTFQSIANGFKDGLNFNPAEMGINTVNGFVDSAISGAISGFVFNKCKKQIAQDNITHLSDIIISYDTSPFNYRYYGIETDNGVPTIAGYHNMENYYPLQIFSNFNDTILGKLYEKAKGRFDNIWYENRSPKLNLFKKECTERVNNYMSKCEDSIHISF